jgi:NAD(P)-dependent dehydrogenase (short-subunit alcohol dehydrogenase family)
MPPWISFVKDLVAVSSEGSVARMPQALGSSEGEIVEMERSIPLGRIAQPDEIVRAAVLRASESGGFVTGQTLHVNGVSSLA